MEENKKQIILTKHKWPDEIAKEKRSRRTKVVIVLACIACLVGGIFIGRIGNGSDTQTSSVKLNEVESQKFQTIYDHLQNDWYFGKDIKDLDQYIIDHAIKGIANENDADIHTEYLDKKDASTLMTSLSGSLTGIGIQYYEMNGAILVDKVFMDSPADKAGMKEGDIIKKVDGVDIKDKKIDDIKNMIVGEEGSKVVIEVLRGKETLSLEMIRAEVSLTVYGYIIKDTGVLEIASFSDNTAMEVAKYLASFDKQNVKNIIIDLRNNGGGYVNTAIDIASLFMEEGKPVLYQEDKDGNISEYDTQKVETRYTYDKIGILINENTASASELLTAAMKDHLNAQIIGVKSYGKGTVQTSIQFDDGSIFKYTIAEWLTPNKEKIHKVGITPDDEVKLDEAMSYGASGDENTYKVDMVGAGVKDMQVYLSFLGYDVDRKDGYYSQATASAVKQFQKDTGLKENGEITPELVSSAISASSRKWHDEKDKVDTQMIKALEVVSGA